MQLQCYLTNAFRAPQRKTGPFRCVVGESLRWISQCTMSNIAGVCVFVFVLVSRLRASSQRASKRGNSGSNCAAKLAPLA